MKQSDRRRLLQRWAELRALWNEFDPIGVTELGPQDEYDACLAPTWRCLERGAGIAELAAFLQSLVRNRIGVEPDPDATERFARRLDAWFRSEPGD